MTVAGMACVSSATTATAVAADTISNRSATMGRYAKPLNDTKADADRHIAAHNKSITRWLITGRETRHEPKHSANGRQSFACPNIRTVANLNPFAWPIIKDEAIVSAPHYETAFYNAKQEA